MPDRPHSGKFLAGMVLLPAAAFLLPLVLALISPDVGRPLVFDFFGRIGWPLVILFYSLATVALLLAGFLRYRRNPRLLAACITLSLLLHFLLMAVFSLWVIQRRLPSGGEKEQHYAVGLGLPSQAESRIADNLHDRLREENRADARQIEAGRTATGEPTTPSTARPDKTPAMADSAQAPSRLDPRTAAAEASAQRAREELAKAEQAAAEVRRDEIARAKTLETSKDASSAESRAAEREKLEVARAEAAKNAELSREHERAEVKEVDRRPDRAPDSDAPEAVARAQRIRESLEKTSIAQPQNVALDRRAATLASRKGESSEAAKDARQREVQVAKVERELAEASAALKNAPSTKGSTAEADRRRMERELPGLAEKAPEAPAESTAPTLLARLSDAAKAMNPFGKVETVERTTDAAAPAGPRTEAERSEIAASRAAGRMSDAEGAMEHLSAAISGGTGRETGGKLAADTASAGTSLSQRNVQAEEGIAEHQGTGARAATKTTTAVGGGMPLLASNVGREAGGTRGGEDGRATMATDKAAGGMAEPESGASSLLREGGWAETLVRADGGAKLVQTAPGVGEGDRRAVPEAGESAMGESGRAGTSVPAIALPTLSATSLSSSKGSETVAAARDLQARGDIGQVRTGRGELAGHGAEVGMVRWEGDAGAGRDDAGASRLLQADEGDFAKADGQAARGVTESLAAAGAAGGTTRQVVVGGQARGLARTAGPAEGRGERTFQGVGDLLVSRAAGSAGEGDAAALQDGVSGRALTQLASAQTASGGGRLTDDATLSSVSGGGRTRADVSESLQGGSGRAPSWLAQTLVDLGGAPQAPARRGEGRGGEATAAVPASDRRAFEVARSGSTGGGAAIAEAAALTAGGAPREGTLDRVAEDRAPLRVAIASIGGGAPTGFELPEKLSEPEPSIRKGISLSSVGRAPTPTSLSQKSIYVMRQPETRQKHVAELGGTVETERAVEDALVWLSRAQSDDGRWDVDNFKTARACGGAGDRIDGDVALSGLTLLTYLGAGYTHLDGRYKDTVRTGLEWILSGQKPNGDLRRGGQMYGQAMATAALSECYSMTKDERLREPLEQAVKFILESQNPGAGWRYQPGEDNDTSVVGWMVLALKSAQIAGIDVPRKHFDWAAKWLETVRKGERGGLFAYKEGHGATPVMTAEGWFCEMFLNERSDVRGQEEAVAFLMESPPVWTAKREPGGPLVHMYYWYYATLSLYISGEPEFGKWNSMLTAALLKGQRNDGAAKGSWDPVCLLGDRGGRVYTTAMGALCLEVYYRYLPFYKGGGKKG